nr:hypothetical protein [Angustibacter aerolatus]
MRRRLTLAGLLAPPLLWLVVAYLGALAAIFATAVWTTDPFTNQVVRTFTLDNVTGLFGDPVYLRIIGRTLLVAAAVTVLCVLVAVPFAFFMAKVAPPRARRLLVALVLVPLWASLPGEGVRLAGRAGAERRARQHVRRHPGLRPGRGGAHAHVPLAPVHGAAGLRRARAAARLAPAGLGRPRRGQRHDVPPHRAAGPAAVGGGRHRVHVLAEPRRLHRGADRRRQGAGAGHRRAAEHQPRPAVRGDPGHRERRDHGRLPARRPSCRRPGQPVTTADRRTPCA